ncbi:MAG: ubiquinone/menaquinone biosynthesis C-methylase UbiE [Halobacteriales archaeon]|jgi:ubiquinone/menaquinone biosynthesis C-methylase UbiE
MSRHGDVVPFDWLARPYDLVMPGADAEALAAGLARADRTVERALDVGGGSGRAARAVAGIDWTVVDAARGMLGVAGGHGLPTVQGDAATLPIRDGSVDAVVFLDSWHHVGRQRVAVEEAARVLRPGGVLVVREFDPSTVRGRGLVLAEHLVGFDSSFLTPDSLAVLAEEYGLRAEVPDRGFVYTVAATKPGRESGTEPETEGGTEPALESEPE